MSLVARNLSFRHADGPWILNDADFAIAEGEVVTLCGPSGIGKSTLGRLLAGYEIPTSGRIEIDGAKSGAGFHPVQLVHQHPEMAVDPRWRIGRILSEAFTPDDALRSRFGIRPEWLDRYPNELSAGQLQRVAIVRALAPQLRFLVADEITTMLDAIAQAEIWNALLDIARARRIGVLAITHNASLAARLSAQRFELRMGRIEPNPSPKAS